MYIRFISTFIFLRFRYIHVKRITPYVMHGGWNPGRSRRRHRIKYYIIAAFLTPVLAICLRRRPIIIGRGTAVHVGWRDTSFISFRICTFRYYTTATVHYIHTHTHTHTYYSQTCTHRPWLLWNIWRHWKRAVYSNTHTANPRYIRHKSVCSGLILLQWSQ